jgi:hypothetical protein
VIRHRPHPVTGEELGENVGHGPAVLDHVRDARWRTQVVLEHPIAALGVADEVYPGHLDADAIWRGEVSRFTVEMRRGKDEPAGQHPVSEYLLGPINVRQESLEGTHALGHAALDDQPFIGRDDPRDEVEGERPLLARQGKSYPLVPEAPVTRQAASPVVLGRQRPQDVVQRHVMGPGGSTRPPVPPARSLLAFEEIS